MILSTDIARVGMHIRNLNFGIKNINEAKITEVFQDPTVPESQWYFRVEWIVPAPGTNCLPANHKFNNWTAWEVIGQFSNATLSVVKKAEKPCLTCKHQNDLGVSTCWYCGNSPH